jgi:hypothetical protein
MDEVKERAGIALFEFNSGRLPLGPIPNYLKKAFIVEEYEVMNSVLPTRLRAIRLYKELVRIGRDYPNPKYVAVGRPLKTY